MGLTLQPGYVVIIRLFDSNQTLHCPHYTTTSVTLGTNELLDSIGHISYAPGPRDWTSQTMTEAW